jgi:hypothetical protein
VTLVHDEVDNQKSRSHIALFEGAFLSATRGVAKENDLAICDSEEAARRNNVFSTLRGMRCVAKGCAGVADAIMYGGLEECLVGECGVLLDRFGSCDE